jgi:hypothetical protein
MPNTLSLEGSTPEDERRRQAEAAGAAIEHLSRLNGEHELQVAILALLLPAGSKRAARAWQMETSGTPNAAALREYVQLLPGTARLPWFETLVSRMRAQPQTVRKDLLEATRRVMGARGTIRPIDRLHWLAMRQRLGGSSAAGARTAAATDLSQLPQADVSAIAMYCAFLSRLVPVDESDTPDPADPSKPAPGVAWYEAVMAPWQARTAVPPCKPPDNDGLVHALQELQTLTWMQRPVLARAWVTAAQQYSRHRRLSDGAADALRLSCSLIDSPLPPELERHYAA